MGYAARVRDNSRLLALLLRWLDAQPLGGWIGTAGDLRAELEDAARQLSRPAVTVPARAGMSRAVELLTPALRAAGWHVGFRRTGTARYIGFVRLADG